MPKIAWVLLPLALYGLCLAGTLLLRRGRLSRHALNIQISLLLMFYLAATAGLGIFWVANQQLPVFDWHYLFGYGTVALLLVHLYFNLPLVWTALRKPRRAESPAKGRRSRAGLAALAALAAGYLLGGLQQESAPLSGAQAMPGIEAVLRFHESSSESRRAAFARAPAVDWGAPPAAFKAYPERPHIPLERGNAATRGLSESLRGPGPVPGTLRLRELGELLYLSAGVTQRRGGQALRASPSSGALFSGELYVLASSVKGLAPGVYHYDADRHRLAALGPLAAASGLASDDAAATIVLTSVVRRTAYKYKVRAYRYVTADAGHLLENLRVAGQALGMHPVLARQFEERTLARTLGGDGVQEIVLAAMELRRTAPPAARPGRQFVAPAEVSSTIGVTGLVHSATSLRLPQPLEPGELTSLPAPEQSGIAVHKAIAERRSQRRFTRDPVALAVLASILADMNQPDQLSGAVRINLIVSRVEGLEPGVYRYDPRHALRLVRQGDFAAAAESAALSQAVIGDAAVVLVLSAEREAMLTEGARGYRHGFIEAGLIGERWLLGAVARRLGACPVGAFYDDEAATLIRVDARREWVLHFAALGVPAKD
ncbi:SagB/ThcOx family dehydrogenase [Massilia endophytica]|uniref:SagB/ThcOx family dehydrogenase n=1 Tax=Massilia endophytica TaxID=2899220 RepID=UPI001E61CAB7|nr:SagB/ThcOx family dehydrogenase [Massilia endophytica]UGQ46922.1 SagB/ThcOx family dehydrogenase [Massilia endophytica]